MQLESVKYPESVCGYSAIVDFGDGPPEPFAWFCFKREPEIGDTIKIIIGPGSTEGTLKITSIRKGTISCKLYRTTTTET